MTTTIQRGSFRRKATQLLPMLLAACYLAGPAAQAAPTLPQVVAGQASFNQQGNVFSITNTPGTIINWQSFNIGAGEITRFIQQNSDSAVLNRILGQDPTKILGALQSNGKVFLINPNGILFGQGARVDVNGLVASTLNLSDADFLAGKKNFQAGAGTTPGAVRNEGAIATPNGGKVFLVAPNIENTGIVTAPDGEVVLAAGRSVQLVDSSDPNLQVVVSAPGDQALNLGTLIAQGGRIGIFGALVNQRGLVNADSAVVGANGKIVLKASGSTLLAAGSTTSASGAGQGGEIQVLGKQVAIEGRASVDASGKQGGGTVLVGGDYQGGLGTLSSVQRAQSTRMDAGAGIRADATVEGKGGKVVLWSDGETRAAGSISARGIGGGNGGLVETSGHVLDVDGIAVSAAGGKLGKNGSWLLDPYDIEVVAGGTAGVNDVRSSTSGAQTGLTRVAPSTLTAAGTDVVLQAQHDLTISDTIEAAGSVRAQAGNDITVNARVASRDGDLDFRAGNAFHLGAAGSLETGNYIDIAANKVTLAGAVGKGTGTQLPILTLTSTDPGRTIAVGAGSDAGILWLDAATLGRLSAGLFEINLGNSQHTGPVSIESALNASSNLVLENSGKIYVKAPVNLTANPDSRFIASLYGGSNGLIQVGNPVTASKSVLLQGDRVWIAAAVNATGAGGSVTLMPNNTGTDMTIGGAGNEVGFSIGQDALSSIHASTLTIGGLAGGTGGLDVAGMVNLTGEGALPKLVLDAGSGELAIRAPLLSAGTVALNSGLGIYETAEGAIEASAVAVRGGQVVLSGANRIGTFASNSDGANVFQLTNDGALTIGSVDGLSGVSANGGALQFKVAGNLRLDADVRGGVMAQLEAGSVSGNGTLQADTVSLRTTSGIGSATAPLHTEAKALMAWNAGEGSRPINIANQGALVLISAVQDGPANTGAIAIDSVGGMTVPAYAGNEEPGYSVGDVRTGSGDISLTTHSPLSILGRVTTDSGNVRLVADNGGALTIAEGARVASASGSVSITAGTTQIAANAISVSSPDKLHVNSGSTGGQPDPVPGQDPDPGQNKPPTLETCLVTPGAAGCADVISKAVQACTIDPNGANCAQVLPKLETCQANPAAPGCSVVLSRHEIDVCLADPKLPGCGATLPTYDACKATPSSYGCGTVIQRHDAVSACIANPQAPGCAQTLPTLAECRADAGVYGCAPVLARDRFLGCVAHPEGAGCLENVLPKLPVCKLTPSAEGCAQVLELTFLSCLANPNDPSCSGVLPTLSQCVIKSAERGCDAVLPTLAQCIGSPSLQGCGVRLPSLQTCAASPSTAGCEAVLPKPDFCGAHPADLSCAIFTGNGGSAQNADGKQVAQAVQGVVQLINQSKPGATTPGAGQQGEAQDDKNPGQGGRAAGPAQAENTGAKNEKPATKLYCN
ncbi:Heme/hemopexin-binding protein [Massilia sp. Bi118]|uniref:two-partner secretion domain-containing protein n=1 Tax=Massilia sp. Bi118 TaxID=2822346 RepID=UPI001D88B041|nr:filamentous hemagglutinin N-terminal domain-containing protein [Massilia sp. Bi118]CAH0232765.1 Heme/hemopexin-binding protein [Massilia sp. Bi118]